VHNLNTYVLILNKYHNRSKHWVGEDVLLNRVDIYSKLLNVKV